METVSKRLKELRESAGYSPVEFALMFGISRSSVYRYEGGNVKESREILTASWKTRAANPKSFPA